MTDLLSNFELRGCAVVPGVVASTQLAHAERYCESLDLSGAGTRDLLEQEWCRDMACEIREKPFIRSLLGNATTAIQCTLFVKDSLSNWSVPLHRDYSVPVKAQVSSPAWSAWSVKQSVVFGRPPIELLKSLVTVRVHLEDTGEENGALHVIEGSHRTAEVSGERSSHFIPRGGAFVMRPLLLHASSKVVSGSRRVLHFVYGPPTLPDGAEWAYAV
jgi:hypothetical protein